MHSLPLFVRLAGKPVILIGEGPAADAKARLIERAGGLIVAVDDPGAAGARLAFVALEDEAEAQEAANRLRARGCIVNVVDQPALCDFTTPAIVDREPVLVAISSGGASAGLVAALRQRIEAVLPDHVGPLARALAAARGALRACWPDAADRRRALARALSPGGALDPLGSAPDVQAWLASPEQGGASETYSLRLRTSDPDDLSLRDARMLGLADHIVHSADVPRAILARARADATRSISSAGVPCVPSTGLTVHIITPL